MYSGLVMQLFKRHIAAISKTTDEQLPFHTKKNELLRERREVFVYLEITQEEMWCSR